MPSREEELVQLLRDATRALHRANAARDEALARQHEPIAIVGMGCRLPGGANDPESYWQLLEQGRDAVQSLEERWRLFGSGARDGVPAWAGLLDQIDGFDPAFFGITPREAVALDPQHRLLLEVTWEALEDAGLLPRALQGSRTGVFVGACASEYLQAIRRLPEGEWDAYGFTGNLLSVAAGRLSYTLGLQGPCLTVDTACSSSLVAVHLACRSLRDGESDLALAGGVNVLGTAETSQLLARTQSLSPDGRCRTFDVGANGFVRGEGCGVIVLKRLSDARRDGDTIGALIRGSATNQDGRSTGLTAPNVLAQEKVLRDALASARIEPRALGYVETHGTGTSLGDPIEVEALRRVLGKRDAGQPPLVLGAAKTNIGHLEGAAGIAGLIKAALALRYGRIPRNINFRTLNPRIDLGDGLAVAAAPVSWPRSSTPRFAGISSFGMSGTNAHVVLGESPPEPEAPAIPSRPAELVVLSARTQAALNAATARLRAHLATHDEVALGDLAYSLATTRTHHEHRWAVAVPTREALLAALVAPHHDAPTKGKLAWLFAGQGSQLLGMGRGLHEAWPRFREALEAAFAALDPHLPAPLRDVMWGSDRAKLDETQFTQPALLALEWALATLWRSWGVTPDFVVGHSLGEITAACVAGVFSLEDAARLVAARGRLMHALPPGGAMVAIAASARDVAAALVGAVSIAAVNAPDAVVIAGDEGAVLRVATGFAERGVRTKRLAVSHAFHSTRMEPMLDAFRAVAASVTYQAATLPVVSNVTGVLAGAELATADYWVRHVRSAVRFAQGIQTLSANDVTAYLEIGPQATLAALVPSCVEPATAVVSSLRAERPEAEAILAALGGLYVGGRTPAFTELFPGGGRRVKLPAYPWQRQRFWIDTGTPAEPAIAHQLVWRIANTPTAAVAGRWIVMASPLGRALATALRESGASPVLVDAIDAAVVEGARAVLIASGDEDGLRALQRLAALGNAAPPVWLFTEGAVSTGKDDPLLHPEQAVLWGMGRAFALEHPQAWGGLVDLPALLDGATARRAIALVAGAESEDQLAVRPTGIFAARIVTSPPPPARPLRLRTDGTVLVTGGLGGLGRHVARWLVDQGIRDLVLTSRSGEAPAELASLGARVHVAAVDVTDRDAMTDLIEAIPRLTAVFHVAGIADTTPLGDLTAERFAEVLAAKREGTLVLDELTRHRELDAFVCFSSIAGVWGSGQQIAYAAANAFLDAWAVRARAEGRAATAISWGPWDGDGMAEEKVRRHLAQRGLRAMPPARALAAMEQALASDRAHTVVVDADWPVFRRAFEAYLARSLFDELEPRTPETPHAETSPLVERLTAMPAGDRHAALVIWLREQCLAVMGGGDPEQLGAARGFFDFGMDSLMVVELRRRAERALALSLSPTISFRFPSLGSLADHLLDKLALSRPAAEIVTKSAIVEDEPIAIIGAGCRLPNGVRDLDGLWTLLANEIDAVGPIPADRFDIEAIYARDRDTRGKTYVREAACLRDVDRFDAAFFGISPREAAWVDPQHRLLVECAWEALESAGVAPARIRGTSVGVYVGIGPSDYASRITALPSEALEPYSVTGGGASFSAGRLAYLLGVHGPALAVDTACSSSLVALHLACRALRGRECDLALAAGVQVMLSPESFVLLSQLHAVAPDGRCKSFAEGADGYGRGEGCGVVALKRLSDARRDGDPILGLVKGSAVNHDGPSSGLTTPNFDAQAAVLRSALANAAVAPTDVDYVEAHGTGTPLGDPIEVEALAEVYGRDRRAPLAIGTIKTNIGHLESAAGIAGLLKVLAALEHGAIPASLHAERPTPHIDWQTSNVRVVQKSETWDRGARPRRAGLSSFGMSGTNAHVVIEEAPPVAFAADGPRDVEALLVSAKTPEALRAYAEEYAEYLARSDAAMRDIAYTASCHRTHFAHRIAVVGADRAAWIEELRTHVAASAPSDPRVAIVFGGQGPQWWGMGRELRATEPVFERALEACSKAMAAFAKWNLLEELGRDEKTSRLADTEVAQPALFAIQVAIYELLKSWGITPAAVVGHSLGEVTAAYASGALALEDAARLVTARGRIMQKATGLGKMAAIELSAADAERLVLDFPGLEVGASNGPTSAVLSGDASALDAALAFLEARGVRSRALPVDYAFHSATMGTLSAELADALRDVPTRAPDLALFSTLTGKRAPKLDASYWGSQIRERVKFHEATRALLEEGIRTFLEVGPHPVLVPSLEATAESMGQSAVVLGSLRRGDGERASLLRALAALHVAGVPVAWEKQWPVPGRVVRLPNYPWQRERHWIDLAPRPSAQGVAAGAWPLGGAALPMPGGVHRVLAVGPRRQPFLRDHVVFGKVVVPGAFHVAVVLAIATDQWPGRAIELTDVELVRAIALEPSEEVDLHAILTPSGDGERHRFELVSATRDGSDSAWTTHARGFVSPTDATPSLAPASVADAAPRVDRDGMIGTIAQMEIAWGPLWRWLRDGRGTRDGAYLRLEPTYPGAHREAPLHPTLLDNAFGVAVLEVFERSSEDDTPYLPFSVGRLRFWRAPTGTVTSDGKARAITEDGTLSDLRLVDEDGSLCAEIEGFALRRAPKGVFLRGQRTLSWSLDWTPLELASAEPDAGTWLVLGEGPLADELAGRLRAGGRVVHTDGPRWSSDGALRGIVCVWSAPEESSHRAAHALAEQGLELLQRERPAGVPMWWCTTAAQQDDAHTEPALATLWGLGRTWRSEHPDPPLVLVDMAASVRPERAVDLLWRALGAPAAANELRLGEDGAETSSLVRAGARRSLLASPSYRLERDGSSTLEGLRAVPCARQAPNASEVEVEIHASGLNFREVLGTLGMYPGDPGELGMEGAGTVVALGEGVTGLALGDPVLVPAGLRRYATVDARQVVVRPEEMTAEAGATVSGAFVTAWWALRTLADVQPGARVLVHAAAGGVGLAAVQLARWWGCTVLATAHPSKWEALRAFGVERIASSRDLSFATEFRDVDVVLNSLTGEFVDASLALLRPGGHFIELGKRDLRDPAALASSHPGVRYHHFDIVQIGVDEKGAVLRAILAAMNAGHLAPLPVQTFPFARAVDAFRWMARGGHVGKIVVGALQPSPVRTESTVLITGGLGALGLVMASWLSRLGVRHLLLVGRRGVESATTAETLAELRDRGTRVTVASVDVADRAALARVLAALPDDAPLRGVIHAAGVLDDGPVLAQRAERLHRVLSPKVDGAWNLHELTRALDLDLFVLFSSLSGVVGAAAQSSYAAANAYLDRLAARRRADGLPALAVAWGAWAGAGMAASLSETDRRRLERQGVRPLEAEAALAALLEALEAPSPTAIIADLDPRITTRREPELPAAPLVSRLAHLDTAARIATMRDLVRGEVARVLGLPLAKVGEDAAFRDLGLDSLMAVELRNALGKRVGSPLPATLAFDYPTPDAVASFLLEKVLRLEQRPASAPAAAPVSSAEPIAIVGIGCRFPGGVRDLASFWQLLDGEIDAVTEVPAERWDVDAWYDPEAGRGKMNTRCGGFLDGLDGLDPFFFGIGPNEAPSIDPQERLLLETTWEALESAGFGADELMGSNTGVFMGICGTEYQARAMRDVDAIDAHSLLGTAHSAMVGRISYWLGIKGPNLPVDTACSSSLVALHLACQALRQEECQLALAGGANVVLDPASTVYFSRLGATSPTGRCRTFSADSDGYVRAEGAGVLVLERLSDALRLGHPVMALIRGSAVNQDGRSNGPTAPNGPSQEAVIREALRRAGVNASSVGYLECHGTGTPLGDPIEVQAAAAVYGEEREAPLVLGSVKTNFGHAEGAAGVGGVIKAVLALEHAKIPRSLHFREPNPHIPWADLPVRVASEALAWPAIAAPRRAAVSSFGFSGTNAHVVLEQAPPVPERRAPEPRGAELFVLSAKTSKALRECAARLREHVAKASWPLEDIAFSLATTRTHHLHRLAIVTASIDELLDALETAARGELPTGSVQGRAQRLASSVVTDDIAGQLASARDDERTSLLRTLAELHVDGHPIAWQKLFATGHRIPLPSYPWQRKRYWIEAS